MVNPRRRRPPLDSPPPAQDDTPWFDSLDEDSPTNPLAVYGLGLLLPLACLYFAISTLLRGQFTLKGKTHSPSLTLTGFNVLTVSLIVAAFGLFLFAHFYLRSRTRFRHTTTLKLLALLLMLLGMATTVTRVALGHT